MTPPRKIARDITRGSDQASRKEVRDREDDSCNAGMRNPADVCKRWSSLTEAMKPIRQALLQAMAENPELQLLPLVVGKTPRIQPPSESAIAKARALVAKTLGLSATEAEAKHTAGKWRYRTIGAVQALCEDPDKVLEGWLKD